MRYALILSAAVFAFAEIAHAQNPAMERGSAAAYSAIVRTGLASGVDNVDVKLVELGRQQIEAEIRKALADDPKAEKSPLLRKVLDKAEEQRKQKIKLLERVLQRLQAELKEMKRGKVSQNDNAERRTSGNGRRESSAGMSYAYDPQTRASRYFLFRTAKFKKDAIASEQKEIADVEKVLKRLQADDLIYVPVLPVYNVAIGKIGQLYDTTSFRVLQVIDGKNMLMVHRRENVFWIKGVYTDGIVSNSWKTLTDLFQVSGTKQYDSADGGTKTVFVLEAVHFDKSRGAQAGLAGVRNHSGPPASVEAAQKLMRQRLEKRKEP
jgi:hypothetical protein